MTSDTNTAADPSVEGVHDTLRLVGGLLALAGQVAHQFTADHNLGCDCRACEEPGPHPAFDPAGWDRWFSDTQRRKQRLAGIVQTAAFQSEWTAAALNGFLDRPVTLDGRTWADDLRALLALEERAAAVAEADDHPDPCVAQATTHT